MHPDPGAMPVPLRTGLCLQCRTALLEGEDCDQGLDHPVALMSDVYGREALIAAVWGPVRARQEHLRARYETERSLGGLAVMGASLGVVVSALLLPVGLTGMALAGFASGSMCWTAGKMVKSKHQQQTYPVGAEPLRFASGPRSTLRGRIAAGDVLVSPVTGMECAAYAMELRYQGPWGDRVMFRDAVCVGMTIVLDSGEIARIAPGRIRLRGLMHQEVDVNDRQVEQHLRALDPRHRDEPFDPFRYNVAYEQVLFAGDHVELAGRFEPTIDTQARPRSAATPLYREPMATILESRGVPVLRLLDEVP